MMIHELEDYPDTLSSIKSLAIIGVDDGLLIDTFTQFKDLCAKPYNYKICAVDDKSGGIMGKYRKIRNVEFVGVHYREHFVLPNPVDLIYTEKFDTIRTPYHFIHNANESMNDGGVLCFTVQSGIDTQYNRPKMILSNGFYNWTIPSLTYLLATNGFECAHYRKRGSLIDVFVYKKTDPLGDVTWYELSDRGLLTDSIKEVVLKYGYLTDDNLVITWIDGRNELASSAAFPKINA